MKKLILIGAISSVALLSACNGGDSGNDGQRVVGGVWTGALTKLTDTCSGSTAPLTLNFSHTVNQNVEDVILTDGSSYTYYGSTLSDNGFSVDSNGHTTALPAGCLENRRIEYQNIDKDLDSTATLDLNISRVCSGVENCKITYSGTASRAVGSNTPLIPDTTPTPSNTPISTGGCFSINPNPAADSYSGDGGCGISTVVYRTSDQVAILEPFGANGATSFTINAANSSAATSNNSNLIILGETGYACSLACSPPATFSVTCFKEGGTTCNEKF